MKKNNNGDKKQDIAIAVLEEKLKNSENALSLQAIEYERRLEILNNQEKKKDDELRRIQETYLPRETYEINHRQLCNKLDDLREEVRRRPTWAITFLISFTLTLLSFMMAYFFVK